MFALADKEWPGTSKLIEECGEVLQVCGKLMGSRGDTNHWSGDLRAKFVEELSDLSAAMAVFITLNMTDEEIAQMDVQTMAKMQKYFQWHENDNK
jgi:NTP pyrophosphatase (non-canonical NTP hydrolase)